jgi:hypothetical protein
MDSRKFEESWKDAFERAEQQPADSVWTNIELDLEKAEGGTIKRRLLFYKLLAAASMTCALGFAGIGFYYMSVKDQAAQSAATMSAPQQLPADDMASPSTDVLPDGSPGTASRDGTPGSSNGETFRASTGTRDGDGVNSQGLVTPSFNSARPSTDLAVNNNGSAGTGIDNKMLPPVLGHEAGQQATDRLTMATGTSGTATRLLAPLYTTPAPKLSFEKAEPDPGALLLARLASEERAYAEEDKRQKDENAERLWTSVGMSAGAFSAVNAGVTSSQPSAAFAANASSVPDQQAKASGYAYSFGVNLGAKVAKRWVVMGGVNYMTQTSDYTATNVVADNNFKTLKAESINQLDMLQSSAGSTSRLAPTFPYNVNNNVQFFSVPVQAGYLVVNKRFSVQMNAGLSTDLFLQNTITPEGGSLDKTTQGNGDDSPYRTLNFSGLMGTEVSYRFGQRYRLSINPGFRYPLNSVYKSDIGVESTPLTFDVGLRFRYIFH